MAAGMASAIGTGVQGLVGIASGMIGSGKRKREQRSAQADYKNNMARFNNLDTSNIYANQQNMYEDSTVNLKEAEFTKAQQMQTQSNIMGGITGSSIIGPITLYVRRIHVCFVAGSHSNRPP